jgi:hypothetical protein
VRVDPTKHPARTRWVAVFVIAIAVALVASLVRRWLSRHPEDQQLPNAEITLVDDEVRDPFVERSHVLRFAFVSIRADGLRLILSPVPLSCAQVADEDDPQVQSSPDSGALSCGGAIVRLTSPPVAGPVFADFGGQQAGSCSSDPSTPPPAPPRKSSLVIEGQTLDTLRGRITVDSSGWFPGRKRPCEATSSYHLTGAGTFEAHICRTRWQRLRARFGI